MTIVLALMSLLVLSALGTSLAVVVNTDQRVAANYAASREAMYAADGALQIAAGELLVVGDWTALLSSGALSVFVDGPPSGTRQLGDGTSVDLGQATTAANRESRPWGPNNPVWQLYAFGWLGSRTYVIVWAGDDPAENDGDPLNDGGGVGNPGAGILALRAEAFGMNGAHKILEVTVRRHLIGPSPEIRMLSWKEIR